MRLTFGEYVSDEPTGLMMQCTEPSQHNQVANALVRLALNTVAIDTERRPIVPIVYFQRRAVAFGPQVEWRLVATDLR